MHLLRLLGMDFLVCRPSLVGDDDLLRLGPFRLRGPPGASLLLRGAGLVVRLLRQGPLPKRSSWTGEFRKRTALLLFFSRFKLLIGFPQYFNDFRTTPTENLTFLL